MRAIPQTSCINGVRWIRLPDDLDQWVAVRKDDLVQFFADWQCRRDPETGESDCDPDANGVCRACGFEALLVVAETLGKEPRR